MPLDDDDMMDRSQELEESTDDSNAYDLDDDEVSKLLDDEVEELDFDDDEDDFDRCLHCGGSDFDELGKCINGCEDEDG